MAMRSTPHQNGLYLNNNNSNDVILVNGGGKVGVDVVNPTYRLQLPNTTGAGGEGRANQWTTYSSREEKRDIAALEDEEYGAVLKKIKEMDLFYYRYKNQEDERRYLGVIAEEAPNQIVTRDRKGLSLSEFAAFAIAGIKAQQAIIEVLKIENVNIKTELINIKGKMAEFNHLKSRMAQLEDAIESIKNMTPDDGAVGVSKTNP